MNHKGATHFTLNDRLTLERMIKEGFSKLDIAKALGKCKRSIYCEIGRGKCVQRTTDYEFVERNCADVAERKYRGCLREKGPEVKIRHDHSLVRRLEELVIERGYSPGAALAEIKNNGEIFETVICENTLYNNYIYRRFFPKGTSFDDVTEEQVAEAERWVNNYPRKLLGWKSAATLFEQGLRAA